MPLDDFLSRDEVLGGLPAKRAQTLLYLIENRVGLLKAKSNRAMDPFFSKETAQDLDMAFLEAFSTGRQSPAPPGIQDLERFASSWTHLVPDNPKLRAALGHALSEKYAFGYSDIPAIRTAIGLDQDPVKRAFQSSYKEPVDSIYRPATGLRDRLSWFFSGVSARIESLPPFWTAFSLTLTETVGAAILALPIALARVGPVVGILLLILLGAVNVATIGFMAEAITRSGTIRYGNAFLGQIISDYLGPAGSVVLSIGLGLICFLALQAYYIGFSSTLADATGIPPWLFTVALFALGIFYITRKSLASTVASALVVGIVNMAIILFISAMALCHMNPQLFKVGKVFAGGFDPSLLELIFGVVLAAYFGHLSICNCGRVVLQRDPSGRSLIKGSMAAMLLSVVIYCIWVLSVNGAVEPGVFEGLPGTAFTPLAKMVPFVHVLGSLFVILGMGMASVHFSLGLFNLVGERLPSHRGRVIVLPRRKGRVVFHQRGRGTDSSRMSIGLTYLGLMESKPRFLVEAQSAKEIRRREIVICGSLDLDRTLDELQALRDREVVLSIEVLEGELEFARLRCNTPLSLAFEGDLEQVGISLSGLLDLSEGERKLLNRMLRSGEVSLDQAATLMEISVEETRKELRKLADQGFIMERQADAGIVYRAVVKSRRTRILPGHIWELLNVPARAPINPLREFLSPGFFSTLILRIKAVLLGDPGRFLLRTSPVLIAFLLTEWMLYTGKGSFSGVLNFLGIIVVPLLGGIFPVLLLASSRRKGEYTPGTVIRFFGSLPILMGIYVLFLASLFIYGLFIWREPWTRASILLTGIFVPALTVWIAKNRGFGRRLAVELRWNEEKGVKNAFRIMSGGEPLEAEVSLQYQHGVKTLRSSEGSVENVAGLKSAAFAIPAHGAEELKILAYSVSADGSSSPLGGILQVNQDDVTRRFDLKLANGSLLIPITGGNLRIAVLFSQSSASLLEEI